MLWLYCFSHIKVVENHVLVPDRCNNNDDSIAPNLNRVLTNELGMFNVNLPNKTFRYIITF